MTIKSKDNANIKLYRELLRSKKSRQEKGLFAIEGVNLCMEAIKENIDIQCVLLTQDAGEKHTKEAFALASNADRIYTITDALSNYLSETKTPQGVFAICKILDKSSIVDKIDIGRRHILLQNMQDPGNLGTIIRTADALGLDGVILTDDCVDIYNPKVIRATSGSIFRLPIYYEDSVVNVAKVLHNKQIKLYGAVVGIPKARELGEFKFEDSLVIAIGNEGNGLTSEAISACDDLLTVKMKGNAESLNAAMAAGIIMWEMQK